LRARAIYLDGLPEIGGRKLRMGAKQVASRIDRHTGQRLGVKDPAGRMNRDAAGIGHEFPPSSVPRLELAVVQRLRGQTAIFSHRAIPGIAIGQDDG
jgi:hypothetical protein